MTITRFVLSKLKVFEDKVGHSGFEIPVDQGERIQIECRMRNHQQPVLGYSQSSACGVVDATSMTIQISQACKRH